MYFFFSSRRRHTRSDRDWSSDVCSSDLPSATAAVVENKTYTVTPASVTVKAGIITGEVTELKVMERVEQGSDRVVSPAKLRGRPNLKNTSANQTARLAPAKILTIVAQGQPTNSRRQRPGPAA